MGITQLVDKFYDKVENYKSGDVPNMVLGQIAWVPTLFIDHNLSIIEAERAKREDHNNIRFKISTMRSGDHFKAKNDRLPIPYLRLENTEELMAFKAKKRPCVFVGKANLKISSQDLKNMPKNKKYLLSKDYLFIPIHSTHKGNDFKGYPEELVLRIKHFQYNHLFFLPECNLKGLDSFPLKEGILRLDRIFVAFPKIPNITSTDVKLNAEYFKILRYHLKEYLLQETEEELFELRELLTDVYDKIEIS